MTIALVCMGVYPSTNADELRRLPDEKLEEIASGMNGRVAECPECGEFTAFVARPTYNDVSKCHNCDYRE